MMTVPVLLPVSGRAAVREKGILKDLLRALIDHWPSSLWDSAKSVREAPFLMLKRMQDRESSKIKLRDLL